MSEGVHYESIQTSVLASLKNRMQQMRQIGNRDEFESTKAEVERILAALADFSPEMREEYAHLLDETWDASRLLVGAMARRSNSPRE